MPMQIKTLENISLPEMTAAFNAGFEEYFIPLHVTEAQMQERIITESVDMSLSVGMFDNNSLIGFILTGIDSVNGVLTANNAGTGVAASFRGQAITRKLYQFLLPVLKERGVRHSQLEVITENAIAKHIYEKIGYKVVRELVSYKATEPFNTVLNVNYRFADELDERWLSFCDAAPSWQYTPTAIRKTTDKTVIEMVEGDTVIAAGVLKPANGRVMFFGVHKAYRRKGIGTALFSIMSNKAKAPLTVVNVDQVYEEIGMFLERLGMTRLLSQYEMFMDIE